MSGQALQAERGCALGRAEGEQGPSGTTLRRPASRRAIPSTSRSSSSGSMRTFESEPMQIPMPRSQQRLDRRVAVAEVRLGRRAEADAGTGVGEEVELVRVGVRGVDDGRPRAETARAGEQLDRADAVLGEAFLDLARLLVGVDVER